MPARIRLDYRQYDAATECVFCLDLQVDKGLLVSLTDQFRKKNRVGDDDIHFYGAAILGLDVAKFDEVLNASPVARQWSSENTDSETDCWFDRKDFTLEDYMIGYISNVLYIDVMSMLERSEVNHDLLGVPKSQKLLDLDDVSRSMKRWQPFLVGANSKHSYQVKAAREIAKCLGGLYDYQLFLIVSKQVRLSLFGAASLLIEYDWDNEVLSYESNPKSHQFYQLNILRMTAQMIVTEAKKAGFSDEVNLTAFLHWAGDQNFLFNDFFLDKIKKPKGKDQGAFAKALIRCCLSDSEIQQEGGNALIKARINDKEVDSYGLVVFESGKYHSRSLGLSVTARSVNTWIGKLKEDKGN